MESRTETTNGSAAPEAKKPGFKNLIALCTEWLSEVFSLGSLANNDLIGVEINPEFIKILKIDHQREQPVIENFALTRTPPSVMSGNEVKDAGIIAQTLKALLKTNNINSKNAVLFMPRASAIIKMINVDSRLTPDEVESRVWTEAGRLFPNLVGDIYLDFVVTKNSTQENQNEVMLIACRKEQIKPYLEIMDLADLKPAVVDIDTYALERALRLITKQSPEKTTRALLDINFSMITLIITHENKLIYSHELHYDGHILMQKIVKNETLSKDEINTLLKNTLSSHLRHALQFFYSSRPNVRIDDVLLSGDCAATINHFVKYIEAEIGKEVQLANPFKNMIIRPNVDTEKLMKFAPALMLCCGLAISQAQGSS